MADARDEHHTRADRLRRLVVGAFFVLLILVGLVSFRDYGVAWDEPDYYQYGHLTQQFYETGDRGFESFSNLRFYGPAIPLVHASIADVLQVSPRSTIPPAHLVNFSIFILGVVALYRLLLLQTRRWEWALFGAAALVLSPRIFSHAFVNPKDGTFLSLFTINMYLLVRYLESRRLVVLAALGAATGLLLDIRVVGVLAVGLVVGAIALDTLSIEGGARLRAFIRPTTLYLVCVLPVAVALWPFLWPDPLERLGQSLQVMRDFTTGPRVNFFMGRDVSITDLPWYYVPVWIGITTPIAYLVLAFVGLMRTMRFRFISLFRTGGRDRHYLLYGVWMLAAPFMTIAGRTPLYDEWRHVNFIYPALIIFAVAGAQALHGHLRARAARAATMFGVALVVSLVGVGLTMVRLHPYQALYFNQLAGGGGGAEDSYELDYWGLSYREGLRFLLAEHPGRPLRLFACTSPGRYNAAVLPQGDRLRFVADPSTADYAICAPRSAFPPVQAGEEYLPEFRTIFTVARDGATFLYVKDLQAPAD